MYIELNAATAASISQHASLLAASILVAGLLFAVFALQRSKSSRWPRSDAKQTDVAAAWMSAQCAMVLVARNGQILTLNASAESLLDQGHGQLIGQKLQNLDARELTATASTGPRDQMIEDLALAPRDTLLRIRTQSGIARQLKFSVYPSAHTEDHDPAFLVILSAFDEPVHASHVSGNQLLQEYQTIISEALPGALCTYQQTPNGDSKMVFASANFEDICGTSPDQAWQGPNCCFKHVHQDDIQNLRNSISGAARDGKPWQAEYRLNHPLKGEIWLEERSTPKRKGDGTLMWYGVIFDITKRKQSEQSLTLSRERLAIAIDAAQLGVFDENLTTGRIFASDRFREIGGWPARSEIVIADILNAIHPDDRARVISEIKASQDPAAGGYLLTKHRILRPDGTERWIVSRSETLFEIKDHVRVPTRVIGCVLDITDNVAAEGAANRWLKIFEASGFGLAQIRVSDDTFLTTNRAFAEQRGYLPSELEGKSFSVIFPQNRWNKIAGLMSEIDNVGHMIYETVHIRKDGSTFPALIEITVIKDTAGTPITRIAYSLDISKLRQTEVALIETRQLHLTTVTTLREGIIVCSKEGRVLSCNPSAERILGVSLAEMNAKHSDFASWTCIREDGSPFPPEEFPVVRALADGQSYDNIVMGVLKPGSSEDISDESNFVWLLVNAAPVLDPDSVYTGSAVLSMIDITARKASEKMQTELLQTVEAAQKETQRQRNLFKGIFDGAPDAMIETDMAGQIRSVNPGVKRIFGYEPEELIGQPTRHLYASNNDWDKIGRHIELTGRHDIMNAEVVELTRKGGDIFPGVITGAVLRDENHVAVGYIAVVRDTTRERERDKALEDSKRLESLGRLTAGVAHDFNNLLTVISVNLQLIGMSVHTRDMKRKVEAALLATNMGAKLNQRLTGMARKRRLHARPINLNTTIRGLYDILRVGLGERSTVSLSLVPDLRLTNVDPSEVENVLINLIINSRDAMPEGGVLKIETRNIDIAASEPSDVPPGQYVMLSVADTGIGMDAKVLEHATEPFYTTKDSGSGLGLAAVSDFVRQSTGHLALTSVVGEGTTVTIHLPVFVEPTSSTSFVPPLSIPSNRQRTRILFVEDNQPVHDAVAQYLRSLGYDILSANNAQQALKIASDNADLDLLFTDLVLSGGGSGQDLAQKISITNPDIKVLYTSGYSDDDDNNSEELEYLLKKPYPLDELRRVIADKLANF